MGSAIPGLGESGHPVLSSAYPMPDSNPSQISPLSSDASFASWLLAKRNLVYTLAIPAALFWIVFYLQFTVDDSFISFRYGKNLIAHHVWNWNPSGTREEGYTSAVYAILGIIPALLHIAPSLFFKLVGLACIGTMLYRLRTASVSGIAFLLGIVLIGLHPWVWILSFAGLETPAYMLLLLEMAICVHRAQTVAPAWVYTVFLLLPLTRPDGIVFACVGVALFWYHRGAAPKRYAGFALAILIGAIYFLARWRYFHHLLPNPYYFKLATVPWVVIRSSLLDNLSESKGYFLVLILIAVLARKSYTRVFALTGIVLLLLLYAPHMMDMNYADRFYFQVAFPFLLFFLIAEDLAPIARVAAVVAAISLFSITVPFLRMELKYFPYWNWSDIDLGKQIAPFAANHTLITADGGAIPYYSNWTCYDIQGLGNYRIAKETVTVPLLQELHPDLMLLESFEPGPGVLNDGGLRSTPPHLRAEIAYILQSGAYDYVGDSDYLHIYNVEFLRKDTPQHDEIVRALQRNMRTSAAARLAMKDLILQRYVQWSDR